MRTLGEQPPANLPPVYVEPDGHLYEISVTSDLPVNGRGETCLMHVDGAARTIRIHRSVTLPEISAWIADVFGFDQRIIWKPCPSNAPASRPLPMLTISD